MSQDMSRERMCEKLSALLDGEDEFSLRSEQAAAFVRKAAVDAQSRKDWLLYAQIGDTLRSADLAPLPREHEFLNRVSEAISREPIMMLPAAAEKSTSVASPGAHHRPHWTTRIAAGMAAVAGVAVMAWVALPGLQKGGQPGLGVPDARPVVASTGTLSPEMPVAVVQTRVAMTSAPRGDAGLLQTGLHTLPASSGAAGAQIVPVSADMPMVEYLSAHQQMAGSMMPAVPATLRVVADQQVSAR